MIHHGVLQRFHNYLAVLDRQAEVTIDKRSQLLSMRTSFRQISPNSFLPSIVIVHSTAIVASFIEATEMDQPALTIRARPRKITGLFPKVVPHDRRNIAWHYSTTHAPPELRRRSLNGK
jgi:hypothetical protein